MKMKVLMTSHLAAVVSAAMMCVATGVAQAGTATELLLDLQPTGGTTEAGYEPLEATNQDVSLMGSGNYSAFGSSITVDVTGSNLPDGNLDFRAVARNGAAGERENDWIGADARTDGVDATLTVTVTGLPAGIYSWLSGHHDGGTHPSGMASSNGNIGGTMDVSISDSTGTVSLPDGIIQTREDTHLVRSVFATTLISDGSPVSLSFIKDQLQGEVDPLNPVLNSIFAVVNSVELRLIPEPTTFGLFSMGLAGLGVARRRRSLVAASIW